MSIERAGWMVTHPLTDEPVEVVNAEWFRETKAELAAAREALRKAYPYVMDALEFSETPALAAIVREDLEQFIVPALAAQEAVA